MLIRLKQIALLSLLATAATLTASPTTAKQKSVRKFKLVEHTCESGCSDTYESPDGKQVSFVFACHTADAADARAEVKRIISEGTVIRRATSIGRNKRSERTVVLKPMEEGKRAATILWYRKGDICFSYIDAETLDLALEFERSKAAQEPLKPYLRRSK
jgi:hypothetical protein